MVLPLSPKWIKGQAISGVAAGGRRGQSTTPDSEKISKIGKKRGNQDKLGKKRRNLEEKAKIGKVFFTLPLLTDRVGYATASNTR